MLNVIVWLTLGAFVGWIASLLLKTDEADQSPTANLGASVAGALVGGCVGSLMGPQLEGDLSFQSVLFSGGGAMLGLLVANFLLYRAHHHAS